jgi:hypothetical protein
MRRLLHPLRLISRLATLLWLWRNRHDIIRWARFGARLAVNPEARDRDAVLAEAKARIALSMDPRTRLAGDLDIERVADGQVVVRTRVEKPTAEVARDVLGRVSGVHTIEIIDPDEPGEPVAVVSAVAAGSGSATNN